MLKDDRMGSDFDRRKTKKEGGVNDGLNDSSFLVRLDAALLKVAGIFGKGVDVDDEEQVRLIESFHWICLVLLFQLPLLTNFFQSSAKHISREAGDSSEVIENNLEPIFAYSKSWHSLPIV
jgi:hypothetical protein